MNKPERTQGKTRAWPAWLAPGLLLACRYVLAAVFLMAGVFKVADRDGFAGSLSRHSSFDPVVVDVIAAWLPWLELVIGLSLALGYAVCEAALLLSVLLVGFTIYALGHWGDDSCGCFLFPAPIKVEYDWWPPLRNLLLLAVSTGVWWHELVKARRKKKQASPDRQDTTTS